MAACVVWGNACKLTSPATSTASSGGGGLLFFPNGQEKRNFSINSFSFPGRRRRRSSLRADSSNSDRNAEKYAPENEIRRVTSDPVIRNRGWTGYVEKDTAGQTNIYSVEPSVYVSESAISSGSAGFSDEGAENAMAIVAGIGLISIAAASSILLQVGKSRPLQVPSVMEYSGPSLSYYINRLKADEIVQAVTAPAVENTEASLLAEESPSPAPEVSPAEVPAVQLQDSTPIAS